MYIDICLFLYLVALSETFDTSGRVHHAVLAGKEWMALTAQLYL